MAGSRPSLGARSEVVCFCLLALLCAGALSYFAHNSFCDLAFRCGCRSPLNGGWALCNVHNPLPPHCPWCSASYPITILTSPPLVVTVSVCTALLLRHLFSRCCASASSTLLPYLDNSRSSSFSALCSSLSASSSDPLCVSPRSLLSLAIGVPLGFFAYNLLTASIFFLASPSYPFFFWYTRS
jgi:hypothetical protein